MILVLCFNLINNRLWVLISSTGKISDSCIRDLRFNPRLYQKLISVLVWWQKTIIRSGYHRLKFSKKKKKKKVVHVNSIVEILNSNKIIFIFKYINLHVNINEDDTKLGYNENFRKICGMKLKCNKKDTWHKIKIQLGTIFINIL